MPLAPSPCAHVPTLAVGAFPLVADGAAGVEDAGHGQQQRKAHYRAIGGEQVVGCNLQVVDGFRLAGEPLVLMFFAGKGAQRCQGLIHLVECVHASPWRHGRRPPAPPSPPGSSPAVSPYRWPSPASRHHACLCRKSRPLGHPLLRRPPLRSFSPRTFGRPP